MACLTECEAAPKSSSSSSMPTRDLQQVPQSGTMIAAAPPPAPGRRVARRSLQGQGVGGGESG
eukprot:CAMPEP_0179137820 /NCGR_PEP_ID=MMETSP0796-20121207/65770_1 /TAXON_ID=73915 /ORGANISM="Pyrodinium bahamense, Strain pbaha01" /LENGTH=62 /DNA_ID=CAMNT_0020837029 /DNA_START=27 /DNA_END=211 /DNA_ORIENTATION=-